MVLFSLLVFFSVLALAKRVNVVRPMNNPEQWSNDAGQSPIRTTPQTSQQTWYLNHMRNHQLLFPNDVIPISSTMTSNIAPDTRPNRFERARKAREEEAQKIQNELPALETMTIQSLPHTENTDMTGDETKTPDDGSSSTN